jgi:hypothetical protein
MPATASERPQNFKGEVVATNVADLHSDNKAHARDGATEKGTMVNGVGMQPVPA